MAVCAQTVPRSIQGKGLGKKKKEEDIFTYSKTRTLCFIELFINKFSTNFKVDRA